MCAAIEATLTIAAPAPAVRRKASLTWTVPTALVRMTYSALPMLGLTPAVWITEASSPIPAVSLNSRSTACGSVTSQCTGVAVMPSSRSTAAAVSSRSCRTSHSTTACSRPTTRAVACPIPPAPPVMTDTEDMTVNLYWPRGPAPGPAPGSLDPVHESNPDKLDASTLSGVSETALMTLYGRAEQARHPQPIIDDPMAVRLVDRIDFDFTKFGRRGQEMALRSLAFDRAALRYLSDHPRATVVALAEGLQTTFWRLTDAIPDARFRWLTIDLPPIIELRERLLPAEPRIVTLAQTALDFSWIDRVDTDHGVLITAEGLLMYLQPDEAMTL